MVCYNIVYPTVQIRTLKQVKEKMQTVENFEKGIIFKANIIALIVNVPYELLFEVGFFHFGFHDAVHDNFGLLKVKDWI